MPGQQCQRDTYSKQRTPATWLSYRHPAGQSEPGKPGYGLDEGHMSCAKVANQPRGRHVTYSRHERGETRQSDRTSRQEQHPQTRKHQMSYEKPEIVVTE